MGIGCNAFTEPSTPTTYVLDRNRDVKPPVFHASAPSASSTASKQPVPPQPCEGATCGFAAYDFPSNAFACATVLFLSVFPDQGGLGPTARESALFRAHRKVYHFSVACASAYRFRGHANVLFNCLCTGCLKTLFRKIRDGEKGGETFSRHSVLWQNTHSCLTM